MNTIIDYNSILKSLDFLNRKQLEKIRSVIAYKLQTKQADSLEEEDWLLRGVLSELKRRGLANEAQNFRIKQGSYYTAFASFQTKSEKVRELLEESAPNLTFIEKRLLGEVCANKLADYIHWKDLTLKVMLDYIHYVPNAIEREFPGYMAAKMLGVIIQHQF